MAVGRDFAPYAASLRNAVLFISRGPSKLNMRDASKNLIWSLLPPQKDPNPQTGKPIDWRSADTENHTLVRNYIISTLRKLNWHTEEDKFVGTTPYGPKNFTNVIAARRRRRTKARCPCRTFRQQILPFLSREPGMSICFPVVLSSRQPSPSPLIPLTHCNLRIGICRSNRSCSTSCSISPKCSTVYSMPAQDA